MPFRNNVTRLLDARYISYEVFELTKEKHSAEETAALLGVPETHVFKTLVILRETRGRKQLLVMAPGGRELDLRALASALGEKKLRMATQAEAEALTKLQTGGISALALLNKGFEVCLDQSAQALPYIHISAGERGASLRMQVADLRQVTGAKLVTTT